MSPDKPTPRAPKPAPRPRARAKPAAAAAKPEAALDLAAEVLATLALSQRMNRLLLENIAEAAWEASPPGGKGRSIAAIAAHMHNVRHMWLVVSAKGTTIPPKLDRATVTRKQALDALDKSYDALVALIGGSLRDGTRIKNFPAGAVRFTGYLVAHDAHHRGQISSLARMSGHPISQSTMFALWEWGKRGEVPR
jgi:uncharacterized damage-inducible protein DinB